MVHRAAEMAVSMSNLTLRVDELASISASSTNIMSARNMMVLYLHVSEPWGSKASRICAGIR